MSPIDAPLQRRPHRAPRSFKTAAFTLLASLLPCGLLAGETPVFGPGPVAISPEEAAIAADPAAGIEHGVILLVEFEDKEDNLRSLRIGMHMRAKILSNEARDLGNIEIPYDAERWYLKEWWARTIQPDGSVHELRQEDLEEVTEVRTRGREIRRRKGALPGVVPGSVIDYGYVVQQTVDGHVAPWWKLNLQWKWPVRELRYNWVPYEYLASGFVTTRAAGLDVKAERVINTVKVVGRNLSPVKEEPWMPPKDSVRAAVWFFYFDRNENYEDFWNSKAKSVESGATGFMDDRVAIRAALEELAVPAEADVQEKLKRAYDWTIRKVRMNDATSSGTVPAPRREPRSKGRSHIREVLDEGRGNGADRLLLLLALARELGAQAHIVLAPDRTEGHWNRSVLTMSQFDELLVAVRAPGEPLEKAVLLAPHLDLPYGVVPYWVAAAEAMVATADGAQSLTPPSSRAEDNVSESIVEMSFEAEGEPARVLWKRTGTGQHALEQQLSLRVDTEEKRRERLDQICGKSSSFEVSRSATAENADGSPWKRIECEGTLTEVIAEVGMDEIAIPIEGPWIEPYPDFTDTRRVHPIVFAYPCVDRAVLDVTAPPGYSARAAPDPVVIDNPFGAYSLRVTLSDRGYHVERSLRLPHLSLEADRIAGLRRFLQQVRQSDRLRLSFASEAGS